MNGVKLGGIDGANPLGFLAALGALRVLDDHARAHRLVRPRMAWCSEGYWRPVLEGVESVEAIVELVMEDRATWAEEPAVLLAYSKEEARRMGIGEAGAIQDLKPPPSIQRQVFADAARRGGRTARMVAAFGTDVAVDNNGNTKPTALHFTAGQQQFLKMFHQVREGLTAEDVRQAILGPWTYASTLPSFSWTGTGARTWALRASDPSGEKRGSCPGAEWLAVLGLSFFPCVPRGQRVLTTGVRGGWKDSTLTWPLWTVPASASATESLLRTPALEEMTSPARRARGIGAVLAADIVRSDQGGYGSFTPPRIL